MAFGVFLLYGLILLMLLIVLGCGMYSVRWLDQSLDWIGVSSANARSVILDHLLLHFVGFFTIQSVIDSIIDKIIHHYYYLDQTHTENGTLLRFAFKVFCGMLLAVSTELIQWIYLHRFGVDDILVDCLSIVCASGSLLVVANRNYGSWIESRSSM